MSHSELRLGVSSFTVCRNCVKIQPLNGTNYYGGGSGSLPRSASSSPSKPLVPGLRQPAMINDKDIHLYREHASEIKSTLHLLTLRLGWLLISQTILVASYASSFLTILDASKLEGFPPHARGILNAIASLGIITAFLIWIYILFGQIFMSLFEAPLSPDCGLGSTEMKDAPRNKISPSLKLVRFIFCDVCVCFGLPWAFITFWVWVISDLSTHAAV